MCKIPFGLFCSFSHSIHQDGGQWKARAALLSQIFTALWGSHFQVFCVLQPAAKSSFISRRSILLFRFSQHCSSSMTLRLQTGMKNDKLSVQIWWHYPLVIRLPSRSLLILAYRELELEKLDLTTHYQFSVFLKTTHCIFQPMKN